MSLEGEPCKASGLYAVENADEHATVKQRREVRGWFETRLDAGSLFPVPGKQVEFFSNVSVDGEKD